VAVPDRIISAAMSRPLGSRHWVTRRPYRSTSRTAQRRCLPDIKLCKVEVAVEPPWWFHSGASRPQTRIRRDSPLSVKVSPSRILLTRASRMGASSARAIPPSRKSKPIPIATSNGMPVSSARRSLKRLKCLYMQPLSLGSSSHCKLLPRSKRGRNRCECRRRAEGYMQCALSSNSKGWARGHAV